MSLIHKKLILMINDLMPAMMYMYKHSIVYVYYVYTSKCSST